jgi:4-deoxy-L-threo-5-hexosulose-uronate ketol-isomerase
MNADRPSMDAVRARTATTQELRDGFLVEELFAAGEARTLRTAEDDMLIAGIVPVAGELGLPEAAVQGREYGVINLGERGEVVVDGEAHALEHRDGLYAGAGATLSFRGEGARFYVVAVAADTTHPTVLIPFAASDGVAIGDEAGAGRRVLHKYVWGDGPVASSQLQLGVTVLEPGAVWNTFPPHLHERRTEIYLYFELPEAGRVVHLMGEPDHTRHLVVANEQAVIAPRWSIHTGAGTARYSFVWAMAGDNRDYGDLDPVSPQVLR